MEYSKLILIGDSHFRGDGAEWPKLYGHLGPIPNEYRSNIWATKIKTADEATLIELNKQFYSAIGDKVLQNKDVVIQIRKSYSFGPILAKELGLKYENYAQGSSDVSKILPFFKYHCNHENLKNVLVIAGIPNAIENLSYQQKGEKLKNITIKHIASNIMLMKEYVENRGGHFLYMHTEDFPEELYDPKHNPYLMDLMLLLLHRGNLQSLLSNAYYWRKYDGKYFDAGAQKALAHKLKELVVNQL